MKKDRNSFFSEYNMNAYNSVPNMMPNMYPNQVSSQSSFYSGPVIDNNYQNQNMGMNNYTNDIYARISKLERQMNRIETRLSKLESGINYNVDKDINDNLYNNNMYMV